MKTTGKILTFSLIVLMLVGTVGITQVSHMCKMAIAGIEKSCCSGGGCETDPCCNSESSDDRNPIPAQEEDCCTDVVNYYHQKVNTTIQENYKVQPFQVFVSLSDFYKPIADPGFYFLRLTNPEFPPGKTGQSLIISYSSLLI